MAQLVFELGTEELPASSVRRAYEALGTGIASQLVEAGVLDGQAKVESMGTPRRLIVGIDGVVEQQPDTSKEMRGPGLKASYDADGKPTGALIGFCRGQGVDPSAVRNDGQYVWITKEIPGKPTLELLAEIVPAAIRALTFDKTMRWGTGRMRFSRPIRWMVLLFGGQVVPIEIEGVVAGSMSRGHRFYAPEEFQVTGFDQFLAALRNRFVEPDPEIRKDRIVSLAPALTQGSPILDDELVDENVFLTEWPQPVVGLFEESFLELPRPVLVTAMAKHERMFPVVDSENNMTREFVFVRNSGQDDGVRAGCQWVLNARFNDARFFFDEDKKTDLDGFLAKTANIVYMDKLGSVRERTERLVKLSQAVAGITSASEGEMEFLKTAAHYSKVDLATGLVSELASLQGVVGGDYARREGIPEPVAWAISTQYDLSKNENPNTDESRTAVRLVMVDQIDKLAGCLGLGMEPSGSSDPYGLRRAATLLIEAALSWPGALGSYREVFEASLLIHSVHGIPVDPVRGVDSLVSLFSNRYPVLMPSYRYDVLQAALDANLIDETLSPKRVRFRANLLTELVVDTGFVQTATRPLNILAAAAKKGISFEVQDPLGRLEAAHLDSETGVELLQALKDQEEDLFRATNEERVSDAAKLLKNLSGPLTRYFDATLLMSEDEKVRFARLSLAQAAAIQLRSAGDFSKIVIEGN